MSATNAFNNAYTGKDPETPAAAGGVLLAQLVLIPLVFVLLWNYGATELIENLGGPDANLGVIEGVLALYFVRGLLSIARG